MSDLHQIALADVIIRLRFSRIVFNSASLTSIIFSVKTRKECIRRLILRRERERDTYDKKQFDKISDQPE